MKFFTEVIKHWEKLKVNGCKLPVSFTTTVRVYLQHSDKDKDKLESYCISNGIKLEVL